MMCDVQVHAWAGHSKCVYSDILCMLQFCNPSYITNNKHGHLSQHAACRWAHARPQGRWSDLDGYANAALDPTRTHMHLLLQTTNHNMLSWPLYNAKWWLCSMLFVFCELWGMVGPVGERRCVEQPILLLSVVWCGMTCE